LAGYNLRNPAFQDFFDNRVDPLVDIASSPSNPQQAFEESSRLLTKQFADSIGGNPTKVAEIRLAAQIASGQVQALDSTYCMIRYLGARADLQLSGKRCGTVRCPIGLTEVQVQDTGFHLAQLCRSRAAMRKFGYNSRTLPRLDLDTPNLPNFFCSYEKPSTLQRSCATALRRLGAQFTRLGTLSFDDTNFVAGLLFQQLDTIVYHIP
jgi:hypothetical protein